MPDPVEAAITRFSPDRIRGITDRCTGVGTWIPIQVAIFHLMHKKTFIMISFNISIVPWAVNAAAMSLSRPKLPKVPEPTGDVRTLSEPDEAMASDTLKGDDSPILRMDSMLSGGRDS